MFPTRGRAQFTAHHVMMLSAALVSASVAGLLAGCAADSPVVEGLLVVPGYYDTLNCTDLVREFQTSGARVKDLTGLMEKSGAGDAGAVMNALAYNTDYAKARASHKYSEEAARRKGCDLSVKVAPIKPDTTLPNSKMPDFGTTPAPGRY